MPSENRLVVKVQLTRHQRDAFRRVLTNPVVASALKAFSQGYEKISFEKGSKRLLAALDRAEERYAERNR